MTTVSNILSYNSAEANINSCIKRSIPYQDLRVFKNSLVTCKRPKPLIAIVESRCSYVHPNLLFVRGLPFKGSLIEKKQSNQQVENLVDKVTILNLQTIIFPAESIEAVHKEVEVPVFPLNLVSRIATECDLQTILLSVPFSIPANTVIRNNLLFLDEKPMQSSREAKLIRWILTSHNVHGLALTMLHNFIDICCQKPEKRNFINESLVPRIRYTGFAFSATAGVIHHVAIGILFTPLVAATLGQKKEINEIWYGYWAGASISVMGVVIGMFGMISGDYLIRITMEKRIPQFKRLLIYYLNHVQTFCTRLNEVDFPRLSQEVENVNTIVEMVSIIRKLFGIAKNLLPEMILQSCY